MNTLLILFLSLSLQANGHEGPRSMRDVERPAPSIGAISGSGIKASPLVRYLAATLELSQERTVAVQQAVQKHQRLTRTPELLTQCLERVLTTDEFSRYERLQNRAEVAQNLRTLVAR